MMRLQVVVAVILFALISGTSHAGPCKQVDKVAGRIAAVPGVVLAAGGTLIASGIHAVPHSSGAWIAASAAGTYLPNTIGPVGAAVAFLTNPVTLTVAGIAVATAGGVVVVCHLTHDRSADAPLGR